MRGLGCGILLMLGAYASAEDVTHVMGNGSWAQAPVVPESMRRRVQEAAAEYRTSGQVSRIGFFDIAFPASASEFRNTGGEGVMLLTVLSHDESELPPKRLVVNVDGEAHELRRISEARVQPEHGAHVSPVLGGHRWDALYAFPVRFVRDGAVLSMDFAKNRDGFVLEAFSTPAEDFGYDIAADVAPFDEAQQADALMELIAREYPGFLDPVL